MLASYYIYAEAPLRLKDFYDSSKIEGIAIDRRIEKAAQLFLCANFPTEKFLDIGCGGGDAALYLAQALGAKEVHGIEISSSAASLARSKGIQAHSLDVNSDPLPYDSESIQAVFCGEVIEHLVDPDHLLTEIHRVLVPSGRCVLTTPNLAAWFNRCALLFGYQPFLTQVSFHYAPGRPFFAPASGGGHLRVFTYRALVEFVKLHGFEVTGCSGAGAFDITAEGEVTWAKRLFRPLDRMFSRFPSMACDVLLSLRKRNPHV